VLTRQPDRVPVERDQAPTRGSLRGPDGDQVAVGDALLLDHRHSSVEVERPTELLQSQVRSRVAVSRRSSNQDGVT
jgi:hypothetical protein